MNEIFPCLACYGQRLKFVVRKSKQKQAKLVKENDKEEIEKGFLKVIFTIRFNHFLLVIIYKYL